MTNALHYITSDTSAGLDTSFYSSAEEFGAAMREIIISHIPEAASQIGTDAFPTWEDYWDNNDLTEIHDRDRASYTWGTVDRHPYLQNPSFEIRPVIELGDGCESFTEEQRYLNALKDLSKNPDLPAFKTFWSVYLIDDYGLSEVVADRNDKCSAAELMRKLESLKTEPSQEIATIAAVVWEVILDNVCENNDLWVAWREDLGICELRDQVYHLAVWVDQVYKNCLKIDEETTCEFPFDWNFAPAALGFIKIKNEKQYPGPSDYPAPDEIAPQVLAKLK